jgi:hypothetical protein
VEDDRLLRLVFRNEDDNDDVPLLPLGEDDWWNSFRKTMFIIFDDAL